VSIKVIVAEDDYLMREGIRRVLESAPDITVVAECADGEELLAAIDHEAPDVVVTDIRMPPSDVDEGIRVANRLRRTHPQVGVLVLSQFVEPEYALALLEEGSDRRAYLLKERVHDRKAIISAVREVASGGSAFDAKVVEGLVAGRSGGPASPLKALSPRELEVLGEVAQGKSNAAVAESLVLTKSAVEKHINSIFSKLGLAGAQDVSQRVKAALLFLDGSR
jgi:DNA-binding NarL/FixJ family response regulator